MFHWWPYNSLTETGNGMGGQKLKATWAKAESQATWKHTVKIYKKYLLTNKTITIVVLTPEENVLWPQTLESGAALSPLRRRNCLQTQGLEALEKGDKIFDANQIVSVHSP